MDKEQIICGWTDQGIGQRLYGKKKNMTVMKEEISKINFPINRELRDLKKEFMNSYVMRGLA